MPQNLEVLKASPIRAQNKQLVYKIVYNSKALTVILQKKMTIHNCLKVSLNDNNQSEFLSKDFH